MTQSTERRAFLRGRFRNQTVMRPIGAIAGMDFENACTGCGDCAKACPESIIFKDSEGFPVVNLRRGECTFCNACTQACQTGALVDGIAWTWRAAPDASCLARNAVQCRACQDHCPEQAIRFHLKSGGLAEPDFDTEACSGCGACVAPCPVNAIQFTQNSQPAEACPC